MGPGLLSYGRSPGLPSPLLQRRLCGAEQLAQTQGAGHAEQGGWEGVEEVWATIVTDYLALKCARDA